MYISAIFCLGLTLSLRSAAGVRDIQPRWGWYHRSEPSYDG